MAIGFDAGRGRDEPGVRAEAFEVGSVHRCRSYSRATLEKLRRLVRSCHGHDLARQLTSFHQSALSLGRRSHRGRVDAPNSAT